MNPSNADAPTTGKPTVDAGPSRRRLLTALVCGQPDRVPINTYEMAARNPDDWYNQQPSYTRLMDYIRQHTDPITNWTASMSRGDHADVGYMLGSGYPVPMDKTEEKIGESVRTTTVMHTPKGDLRCVIEHNANLHTTWQIEHWCKSLEDVDKALSVPYAPMPCDASGLAKVKEDLGNDGLIMSSLSDPAYMVADLMSVQDYILWLHEDSDHFARAVDIVAPRVMQNLQIMLDTCVVDLYRICGPEYMTPPYAHRESFERFMVPHLTQMTQIIHQAGSKVRLHCHGRIGQVLDMILATGCDGTDPCEPPPDGDIELNEVKRRCFDAGVSVWGNTELKILEQGSTQEVREHVKEVMDQAKAGGGFVLLPTAAPINVPLAAKTQANYMTWIDAALAYGAY